MKRRLKQITYLRAFAALSIVLIHASSGFIWQGNTGFVLNQFARFGSPVFVMISGFILYHIEMIKPSPSYAHFLKHRFSKIAIPYLVWTLIYMFYRIEDVSKGTGDLTTATFVKQYIYNALTGFGYVHLYFVIIMLQLYIFFPILRRLVEDSPKLLLTGSFLVSMGFQVLIYLHQIQMIVLPNLKIAWVALSPGWVFFFCLGIYLRITHKWWTIHWRNHKFVYTVLWGLFFAATLWDTRVNQVYSSLKPSSTFYGVSSFFLFYAVSDYMKDRFPDKIGRFLEWVAANSFNVYLTHPLFLNLFAMHMVWKGTSGMFALYFSTVVTTLICCYVLEKGKGCIKDSPYFNKVSLGKITAGGN